MSTVYIPHFSPKQKKRASKYNNTKTAIDGITFDSKAEALRYSQLKLMLMAGQIKSFNRQPSFILSDGIRYRPDFIVWDGKTIWVEDVKGFSTSTFKVKASEFREKYPYLELRIIK
ncbi:MAG TPA: DUF1064 domain-containing protein [Caproicibacter sp.]|nr:DUF1064 domain-containing protein [Caproicibacter sp.]